MATPITDMSHDASSGSEPDWLRDALRSAVDHARHDRSEETLMRLARDALLLHDHLRPDSGADTGQPVTLAGHHKALAIPASAAQGGTATHGKLESYTQARARPGTALRPEAFVAGDHDRRLALDLGGAEAAPPGQRDVHNARPGRIAAAAMLLLMAFLAAAALI